MGADAITPVGRSVGRDTGLPSLSPASLRDVASVDRLVLPSPNGSTISLGLAEQGLPVVAGSLRNASAVGRYAASVVERGGTVAVIASGERWPDGSLRPAVEDLWGAGAILSTVTAPDLAGPEARVARAAYLAIAPRIASELRACASGRERIDAGFAADVDIAAEFDASEVVPLLTGKVFRPA